MRVRWTYELAALGDGAPIDAAPPLHWDGQHVLLPNSRFEHPREERANEAASRGYRCDLHRVGRDGRGTTESFRVESRIISQCWSFLTVRDEVLLHLGPFYSVTRSRLLGGLPTADAGYGGGRGVFCQHEGRLLFADLRTGMLHCCDPGEEREIWSVSLPSTNRGGTGPVAMRRDRVVCYGRDTLGTFDPATGEVERTFALPGIDMLHPPVERGGELLFVWANWTQGGLLRFDPVRGAVAWRFTKRGRIGATPGGLVVVGRTAILSVNGGSSLVGIDVETGEERWKFRAQWLYTHLEVDGESIVFGTSGGYGRHLRRHRADTGETEWAVQMKGGCPYFTRQGDHVVAGDWAGVLRRIRISDGEITGEIALGGHIATAPLVVGRDVFAYRWPKKQTGSPALVAVEA